MSPLDPSALERIERKLDRVDERIGAIDRGQAIHNTLLEEHQRRSLALEEQVDLLREEINPLKAHQIAWGYVGKGLAGAGSLVGIGLGLWKLLGGGE